jgi:hypothetical protein
LGCDMYRMSFGHHTHSPLSRRTRRQKTTFIPSKASYLMAKYSVAVVAVGSLPVAAALIWLLIA